jgi:hypothetical protein
MKKRIMMSLAVAGMLIAGIAPSTMAAEENNQQGRRKEWSQNNKKDREARKIEILKKALGLSDEKAQQLSKLLVAERKHRQAFKKKLEGILSEEQIKKLRSFMKKMRARHQQREGAGGQRNNSRKRRNQNENNSDQD